MQLIDLEYFIKSQPPIPWNHLRIIKALCLVVNAVNPLKTGDILLLLETMANVSTGERNKCENDFKSISLTRCKDLVKHISTICSYTNSQALNGMKQYLLRALNLDQTRVSQHVKHFRRILVQLT